MQESDVVVARRLLCAAARCEMRDLALACLQYLVDGRRLTADNCLGVWLCAADAEPMFRTCPGQSNAALELIARSRAVAAKQFRHVVASREFLSLSAEQVITAQGRRKGRRGHARRKQFHTGPANPFPSPFPPYTPPCA